MSSFAHDRAPWRWEVTDAEPAPPRRRALSAIVKTRRARWRLAALVAAIIVLATMLAGCAEHALQGRLIEHDYENDLARDQAITDRRLAKSGDTGQSAANPSNNANKPPAAPASVTGAADSSLDDADSPSSLLAEQSQRDVDVLLASRRERGNESSMSSSRASAAPAPKRVVVWNETKRPTPTDAASANASALSSIAAPATTAPATQPDSAGASENSALQPDRMKQLAVDLARELYSAGAYSDQPLRELAVIAAMNMVDADRKLDAAAIPDLTDAERAVLTTLQAFFADVNTSLQSSAPDELQQRVADAAAKLRQSLVHEPTLKLPTIALCTRVNGFGDYAPFDAYTFTAGVENKAIVYLEIGEFVSEINDKGEFVTELSQQLTLYSDRDGIPVWKDDWQNAVDVTKNQRKDFFTVQVITLPKNLSVGKYTLKARVRDDKSKAEAETSVGIEVGLK